MANKKTIEECDLQELKELNYANHKPKLAKEIL